MTYQFQQVDEEVAVLTQFIVSRAAEISKLLETSCGRVTSINHICHVRSENKWCSIPVVIATYKGNYNYTSVFKDLEYTKA